MCLTGEYVKIHYKLNANSTLGTDTLRETKQNKQTNSGASIRIPRFTARDNKGYMEDRRPASNIDPYVVTALIFDTCVLKGDTKVFDGYNANSINV
jgi:hypothetical protein